MRALAAVLLFPSFVFLQHFEPLFRLFLRLVERFVGNLEILCCFFVPFLPFLFQPTVPPFGDGCNFITFVREVPPFIARRTEAKLAFVARGLKNVMTSSIQRTSARMAEEGGNQLERER